MKIGKVVVAIIWLSFMHAANAASVSLIYTGDNDIDQDGVVNATIGDILTFDLLMDFTDRETAGGGFDINWDSSVFAFQSYVSAGLGMPQFSIDPVLEDGRLFNGQVGDINILTAGTIASLSFEVVGVPILSNNSITPSGTNGSSGPWIDAVTTDYIDLVQYNGISVFVPVPSAVWFMLSGLGLLAGVGRRKTI